MRLVGRLTYKIQNSMMQMRFIFMTVFMAFFTFVNAQNATDLGSTPPFMVGLKGTIYKFFLPKVIESDKRIGYTEAIEKSTPIGYVYTQSLNISERNLDQAFPGVPKNVYVFAIIYTGKFEVKEDTIYEFVLKSDDGSRLWIDTTEVINHDGFHQFNIPKKGVIKLKKGFHNIKVWYFQGLATRMGLLLVMKKISEKEWLPFNLKPLEDDLKQTMKVDSNGVAKAQLNERFLFDLGKFDLKPEAESQLLNVAKLLIFNPNAKLKVEGHTDNKGTAKANQLLSENRANAVANALKAMGIPETIVIETIGFGMSKPVAPNTNEEGKAQNRRVEISVSTN
jgi:outer membrane protein OmpA-like peptidoglycan-associated protein